MNQRCAIKQQYSGFSGCGEERMRRNGGVVCPKPRRVGRFDVVVNDHDRHLRRHASSQEWCDTQAANELFDIILSKGASGGVEKQSTSVVVPRASSTPFFNGSPPSRVSNPLIQDVRFGDEVTPYSPRAIPIPPGSGPSPSSNTRKGGCVRGNFGNNPAVRVEGFDCLDRDRRAGSIPTLA